MPMIAEALIDRRGVVFLACSDEARLIRQYEGIIDVGMIFAWEPDLPAVRELVVVCHIDERAGDERRIWTMNIESPMRGRTEI
jgi:hypothetical protein